MSNSSLINYTILSPNYSTRTVPISKLTPHHAAMVGVDSQRIARLFTPASRGASCNYAIGVGGDITLVVPEEFCAWTSGTWGEPNHGNDGMAVTFEIANDGGAPDWHVSDASIEALINLCVDICQRNNIPAINYTGDASGNLTMHQFFSATACPGPYLKSKFPYIADEINKRLGGGTYIAAEQVDVTYGVYTTEWLDNVTNYNETDYNGYAGWEGQPLTGIRAQLSKGNIVYRVHTQQHGWLNWITNLDGYGYAGMYGTPIDGVQMYLDGLTENYHVEYRTGILGGEWLDWVRDYGDGDNGYSGWYGKQLDRIQIRIIGEPIFVPSPKEEPKTYTVTYKGNGGLWNNTDAWSDTATFGQDYYIQPNFFTRDDYIFTSWSENSNTEDNWKGWEGKTWNWSYDRDVTLYAMWESEVKGEPIIVPIYDLDYPEKTLIVDETINRTNDDCIKVIKKILANNTSFDINIAKAFFKLAPKYKIDPLMAISQSIVETGWFKYQGSAVKPEHHNYCGLGVTSNGVEGVIFDTIEDGVTAQLQHLFAYGSTNELDEIILDPRFKYVTRGIAPCWQNLAGRWAVPGYDKNTYSTPQEAMTANATYGQKIRVIYNSILQETVDEIDYQLYFPEQIITPTKPTDPENTETPDDTEIKIPTDTEEPTEPEEKNSSIVLLIIEIIKKIVLSIINIFKRGNK